MSEDILVKHCSPTLIGLKTANMFTYQFKDETDKRNNIRKLNHILGKKGIRVIPLRQKSGRTLIYVFRPSKLNKDLKKHTVKALLAECGYKNVSCGSCIAELMKRLQSSNDFPHEVGLFLGYPPEDVKGFINNAADCKLCGCWKVYDNEEKAQRTFDKYKECTRLCRSLVKKGCTVEQLAVSY